MTSGKAKAVLAANVMAVITVSKQRKEPMAIHGHVCILSQVLHDCFVPLNQQKGLDKKTRVARTNLRHFESSSLAECPPFL